VNETFYGRFYGFNQPPFHITPDPEMVFATETHREALASLEYGIAAGKGFIVLIGEVGVGKTTLLRACIDRLGDGNSKVIYLFDPVLTVAELYRTLLEELGADLEGQSAAQCLRQLQKRLLIEHEKGTRVIIAIDEAQNMPAETLECLRMLSNLETSTAKLMQIILVGQPELDAVLMRHSLRQLAQRIAVKASLKPLTRRQVRQYIAHRIERAGRYGGRPLFTSPALWYIARVSGGIPRSINICCDNALINGFGHGAERITLKIVREACRPFRRPTFRFATATIAVVVIVLGAASAIELRAGLSRNVTVIAQEPDIRRPNVAAEAHDLADQPTTRNQSAATGSSAASVPTPLGDLAEYQSEPAKVLPSVPAPTPAPAPAPAPVATPSSVPAALTATTVEPASPVARAPTAKEVPRRFNSPAAASNSVWHVHYGDTVIAICKVVYGTCGPREKRTLLALNPQIGRRMKINIGDTIVLPDPVPVGPAAARSN